MSHWTLPQSGIPVSVTTVQRATNPEKQTDKMKRRMDDFQPSVQNRWDARTSAVELPPTDEKNVSHPLEARMKSLQKVLME